MQTENSNLTNTTQLMSTISNNKMLIIQRTSSQKSADFNKDRQRIGVQQKNELINNQQQKQIELKTKQSDSPMQHFQQLQDMQYYQHPPQHNIQMNAYGGQPQQQLDPLSMFRQRLNYLTQPDGEKIKELTDLAKLCHSRHAQEVANALFDKIQSSQHRLPFIYILDSILKNVQGQYTSLFEQRIIQVFQDSFRRAQSLDEKKSLIKLFKIWDLFFSQQVMQQISKSLQLPDYERTLLTDTDLQKIRKFQQEFEPLFLPEEVLRSGLFVHGSDTTQENVWARNQSQLHYQQQQQHHNGMMGYQMPQQPGMGMGGAMGMPQQPNPYSQQHLQMHGQTHSPNNLAARSMNMVSQIPQPLADQSQPSNTMMDMLRQLGFPQGGQSQQTTSNSLYMNQVDQIVPQQPAAAVGVTHMSGYHHNQQPQPQPGGVHYMGGMMNKGYGVGMGVGDSQAMMGLGVKAPVTPNAQVNAMVMAQNGGFATGVGNGGVVYPTTHNDLLKTVDQSKLGFLPSILKSFYLFKESQQLLLGQDPRLGPLQGKCRPASFTDPSSLKEFNLLAITEVYESIKYQCSICGMRFIRNMQFKRHLDMHFQKNNEFRRRGNRAVSRPAFMNIRDFVLPSSAKNAKGGQQGNQGQKQYEDMVPYSSKETQCFICKEDFETTFDEDEEIWYFVGTKKIRMQGAQRNGQVVTVHTDCIKQIEINRDVLRQIKEQEEEKKQSEVPAKDSEINNGGYDINQEIQSNDKKGEDESVVYQRSDTLLPIEELEMQTRGLVKSKRQFLGH